MRKYNRYRETATPNNVACISLEVPYRRAAQLQPLTGKENRRQHGVEVTRWAKRPSPAARTHFKGTWSMKISFSLETLTVATTSLHVQHQAQTNQAALHPRSTTWLPALWRNNAQPRRKGPNHNLQRTGRESAYLGLVPRIPHTKLSFPSHLLTRPTGLGFSDALSAVSNTPLIQKLGTSANELMFKKEQEKENLG